MTQVFTFIKPLQIHNISVSLTPCSGENNEMFIYLEGEGVTLRGCTVFFFSSSNKPHML